MRSQPKPGSILAEAFRQFECVCRVAMKLNVVSGGGVKTAHKISLRRIGCEEFGLTTDQATKCIGRARNFLNEVDQLDRLRQSHLKEAA